MPSIHLPPSSVLSLTTHKKSVMVDELMDNYDNVAMIDNLYRRYRNEKFMMLLTVSLINKKQRCIVKTCERIERSDNLSPVLDT